MEDAYHGTTDAVYELSPAEYGEGRPLPAHIATVPAPDGFRGKFRRDDPQYVDQYTACFDDAIASLDARGFAPAAYYLDLILCSNGILVPPPGYLSAAFDKIRAAGGLCVADEVRTSLCLAEHPLCDPFRVLRPIRPALPPSRRGPAHPFQELSRAANRHQA